MKNNTQGLITIFVILASLPIFYFFIKTEIGDGNNKFVWQILTFTAIVVIWSLSSIYLGRRRHTSIIKTKQLETLIKQGFKIEYHNDYVGLIGEYKNYVVQIYFDWSTKVGYLANSGIIFRLYINLPPSEEIRIKALWNKYKIKTFSTDSYSFLFNTYTLTMKNASFLTTMPYFRLIQRLDMAINILKNEKLDPLPIYEVKELLIRKPQYGPQIKLYSNS
jgi:hypothetical protein